MTDAEIVRALAGVMGWAIVGPEIERVGGIDDRCLYYDGCGGFWRSGTSQPTFFQPEVVRTLVPWRPLHSMDDAWMVVERMREQGWDYQIGSVEEGHEALFARGTDVETGGWEEIYDATAPTPQRAIAMAALAACGVENVK